MRRTLSAILFIYGFMAILMGIIDCDGIFFLGLLGCIVAWMVYPKKKRQKYDGGKSPRNSKTWRNNDVR